ncbi:hypothetical protein D3C74_384180 [compost metagenome]
MPADQSGKLGDSAALSGREGDGISLHNRIRQAGQIRFVVGIHRRNALCAQRFERLGGYLHMLFMLRIGSVDHMDQQIRLGHFLQCRAEGLNEVMGQLADETYRIG